MKVDKAKQNKTNKKRSMRNQIPMKTYFAEDKLNLFCWPLKKYTRPDKG